MLEQTFAFGLVADACKENKHSEGRCQRYGEVPSKLSEAVKGWQRSQQSLAFVLSLGDLIDGMPTQVILLHAQDQNHSPALRASILTQNTKYLLTGGNELGLQQDHADSEPVGKVLLDSYAAISEHCTEVLQMSSVDLYHVLGNHCLTVPRQKMLHDLHMPHSYYSRQLPCQWRLIALDTTELSGHSGFPVVSNILSTVPQLNPVLFVRHSTLQTLEEWRSNQ